jgi:hypothetical protein
MKKDIKTVDEKVVEEEMTKEKAIEKAKQARMKEFKKLVDAIVDSARDYGVDDNAVGELYNHALETDAILKALRS